MEQLPSVDNLHEAFIPMDARQGAPISAVIQYKNKDYNVNLWAISPMGADFIWPFTKIDVSEKVDVILYLNQNPITFIGLSICNFVEKNGKQIFGVRWLSEKQSLTKEDREKRWVGSEFYAPTVVCSNPMQFDDILIFRVCNISANGAMLQTSMRNKFIIPGMILGGTWSFPMTGATSNEFKVVWTKIITAAGIQKLALGINFFKPNKELNTISGEYILQFGNAQSISEIKKSGLNIKNAKRSLTVDFAKTEEDYNQVINLRKLAYASYSNDNITELSDKFDTKSRIITARHHGRIAGSVRLIFHKPDDVLEIGEYLTLPNDFPKNFEIVEVSRLAVHPDFQLSSIVLDLLKHCFITMLQTKRRYIVGAAPTHLIKLYESIGVKINKNVFYSPKSCPELKLYLLVFDLYDVLSHPDRVGIIMWNKMYEDLVDYVANRGMVQMTPLKKMNRKIYRFLGRFIMWFHNLTEKIKK